MRTTQTQPIARSATESPRARDFLKVDAHLSEEKDIREKIRSFVEVRIEPNIKDWCERADPAFR